jgi:hypothetical protein
MGLPMHHRPEMGEMLAEGSFIHYISESKYKTRSSGQRIVRILVPRKGHGLILNYDIKSDSWLPMQEDHSRVDQGRRERGKDCNLFYQV